MLQYRVDTDKSMSLTVENYKLAESIYRALKEHLLETNDVKGRYVEIILCDNEKDIHILNRAVPIIDTKKNRLLPPEKQGLESWYTWEDVPFTIVNI